MYEENRDPIEYNDKKRQIERYVEIIQEYVNENERLESHG